MKTSIFKHNLRRILLINIIISILSSFPLYSQITIPSGSQLKIDSATALVSYSKDSQGFWIKRAPKDISDRSELDAVDLIGKNNKNRLLYAVSNTSIIEMSLDKKAYSEYKSDKRLLNLKEKEWEDLYISTSEKLANKFQQLNESRKKEIEDSIAEVRRIEQLKAQEAARREARRRDSILTAEADQKYRETHPYNRLDLTSLKKNLNFTEERSLLKCAVDGCDHRIDDSEMMLMSVKNDTIVYVDFTTPALDISVAKLHALVMNDKFKQDPVIHRHLRVWADSLNSDVESIIDIIDYFNYNSAKEFFNEMKNKAPNGYIDSWGWDNEYGPVSFDVSFCNTNKKVIKYIKFFFSIYNDVGDVRGTGSVQGTGPVDEFETASWSFDRTGCWPRGDASRMRITKILITYMNGSTLTLTGNKIIYN